MPIQRPHLLHHRPTVKKSGSTIEMPRALPLRLVGATSILFGTATFTCLVILAISLASDRRRPYILSIAASILQMMSTGALGCFMINFRHQKSRAESHQSRNNFESRENGVLHILVLGVVPSTMTDVVVGVTLGWCKASEAQRPKKILGRRSDVFLVAAIVIWIGAVLSQIIYYTYLVGTRTRDKCFGGSKSAEEVQTLPEMVEQSRPSTGAAQSIQVHDLRISSSSPPSVAPSDGTSSLRSSLSTVHRPMSSKTRLLIRQHSFPRQSNSFLHHPAPERTSQDGGFDSWDTSSVAPHIRETVHASPILCSQPLEPIPGSRSPSPAKALEGPFYPQPETSSAPASPLPQPSFSRPPSRHRSVSTEDHIHPLFRTCSPTPPPTASSNSVITAAPLAGQIVHGGMIRKMRSGSLPSSPATSPLMRSSSLDRFGTPKPAPSPTTDTPLLLPEHIPLSPTTTLNPAMHPFHHSPPPPLESSSKSTPRVEPSTVTTHYI